MYKVLSRIEKPNDIKKINKRYYPMLADEIRDLIIESVSENDGHLASNLGTVELTMALHLFLDLPKDKLIFDVGHQAYTHKILTGRKAGFSRLRQYGGLSGYPEPSESDCDLFATGHSSTAISLANGLVKARDMMGKKNKVVCVVGDGAISSGLAFEGMNNISRCKSNLIIMLNDNSMSISPNVGGMSKYLSRIRTSSNYVSLKLSTEHALEKIPVVGDRMIKKIRNTKNSLKQLVIPGMLFENMGITYIGPIDGHDIGAILYALKSASQVNGPVIVHCITQKGRGYAPAEKNPSKFHGIGGFDRATGEKAKSSGKSYSSIFGETLCSLAEKDSRVVAVTAAMTDGVGLAEFNERFHNRFFDVGICEEHGVTFSAGLAKGGLIPFFPVYSTFLQRAYDEILHDVCLNNLHVVFLVDRAGIVGHDGKTHQGIFDISYLSQMPNMTVLAPSCADELAEMVRFAYEHQGPIAIRYPRATAVRENISPSPIEAYKADCVIKGSSVCILSTGTLLSEAIEAANLLSEQNGISVRVCNMRFISPFDEATVADALDNYRLTVTLEENVARGGFGQAVCAFAAKRGTKQLRLLNLALKDEFMTHGERGELLAKSGLDSAGIIRSVLDFMGK